MSDTDRIEKASCCASRARVARDQRRARVRRLVPRRARRRARGRQGPYEGASRTPATSTSRWSCVERVEPATLLAYRWHPYAVQPDVDYAAEPTTLVEFRLEDADGGTRLVIVESASTAFRRRAATRPSA